MSNYIALIADMYNEMEEKDRRFKPKIKLSNFFKEDKKTLIVLIIAVISLIVYIVFSFMKVRNSFLYEGIFLMFYCVVLMLLIPLSEKTFQRNYKKNIEAYDSRLEILRKIITNNFNLYEEKKIEELVKQCDLSIEYYKLSDKIFKPIINLTKAMIFPIITFSLGLITTKVEIHLKDTIKITVSVILIIFMFLGLFYVVKYPIENFMDNQSNKIKQLRGMLIDILIKDFI